jgi:hypothetical protein
MKQALLAALLALVVASCGTNVGVLAIDKFFVLGGTCNVSNKLEDLAPQGGGTLDVSIFRPEFFLGVSVVSQLITTGQVSVGATVLESADRDAPSVTNLVFSYKLYRAGKEVTPTPIKGKKYTTQLAVPLQPTSNVYRVWFSTNIIVPAAADALQTVDFVDNLAEGYDLRVSVEVQGKMMRSGNPISTGPVDFPITVINSNPGSCNKLQRSTGPCVYTGQADASQKPDLTKVTCCDPLTSPLVGCDYTK